MASTQDITAAQQTYAGFVRLIKIAAPIIAVITALVIYLLTH
jgi:hypothetical protein